MRSVSLKAAAIAAVAASTLVAGAASASAAPRSATHVTETSKKGQSVSALLTHFKGGDLTVTLDATGTSTAKHTWTLSVDGKKFVAKSYTDKAKAKTWVINDLPTGDVKLAAPASKGQVTKVTLDAK
jgi:YbbR domain-containing protein